MAIDFFEVVSRNPDVLRPVTMYEVQADGTTLVEVVFDENGDFDIPEAPTVLATTAMVTRTSAKIDWTPSPNGAAAVNFVVYRDGSAVSTALPSTARTFTETGLPTATPERIFSYAVVALGASGQASGLSNAVALQWNGNPVQPPPAPTSLTSSAITTTGFTLNWAEAAVTGIQKHTVRRGTGGTIMKDDIGATATSTNITGLTQNTLYSGIYVTRTRTSDGIESGPSPTVDVRTSGGGGGVAHDPRMGASNGDEGQGGITDWEAMRIYSLNHSDTDQWVTNRNVVRVALTPNQGGFGPTASPSTATSALDGYLDWFYNGTGSASRANAEVHFATDNETDRTYGGSALPAAYVACFNACADVIQGYPKASMALNFTHSNIENATKAANFKPLARRLDIFTCSMYPPGRQQDKNGGKVDWTAYSRYTDGVIDVLHDWMTTGGAGGGPSDIRGFATWEIGMPIDNSYWVSGIALNNPDNGEPTRLTDFSIRPRYFCGGRDAGGTNWVGYFQYLYDKLDAIGCPMLEQCYWDQQDNPNIPDPLWHDQHNRAWNDPTSTASGTTRANPDTATAVRNWTPGSRLADL